MNAGGGMDLLKLTALDDEDLRIVSAHLQDAVLKVGDIRFLRREQRFVLVVNRFDHRHGGKQALRRRTGVQFNRVLRARAHKIRQGAPDAVLSLLAVTFEPGDEPPAGTIEMTFSGGGSIRLDVECIEASLEDLGPMWETANVPEHND